MEEASRRNAKNDSLGASDSGKILVSRVKTELEAITKSETAHIMSSAS